MKIILPEENKLKTFNLGDILKSPFGDTYILMKMNNKYAWCNFTNGSCANGIFESFEALIKESHKYLTDPRYIIYGSKDYNLKLVPKETI